MGQEACAHHESPGGIADWGSLVSVSQSGGVEKASELSSECVSTEAERQLSECPKGPTHFDIEKKRVIAAGSRVGQCVVALSF